MDCLNVYLPNLACPENSIFSRWGIREISLDGDLNQDAPKAGLDSATMYRVGGGADENNHRVEELDWIVAGFSCGLIAGLPCGRATILSAMR